MIAAILLPCLIALTLVASPLKGFAADSRPEAGENNVWYAHDDAAETVIVFVHGLASDSRGAWFHEGNGVEDDAYWPELVLQDETFSESAIFLGGFHTGFDSHHYDFRDAANALHLSLKDVIAPASVSVLDKPNILFVAHSAGGIVVRDMLIRKTEDFADKAVGLVLIASPSIGTPDADRLRFIADFVHSKQGRELAFNNPYLEGLDKDFKNLVNEDRIPNLVGTEWLEHHLIISKWFDLYRDSVLVDENTAARYFGESRPIADSDHTSIVKPTGKDQEAHRALRVFYRDEFSEAVVKAALARPVTLVEQDLKAALTLPAKAAGSTEHPMVRPMTTETSPAEPTWREANASEPDKALVPRNKNTDLPGERSMAKVRVGADNLTAPNVGVATATANFESAVIGTSGSTDVADVGTIRTSTIANSSATARLSNEPTPQVAAIGHLGPVRIDEKRAATLCGDRVQIEVTSVWKKGSGQPQGVVTVSSSALDEGKAVVKIGQSLPLDGDCAPTLINTGRDARYYAVFE